MLANSGKFYRKRLTNPNPWRRLHRESLGHPVWQGAPLELRGPQTPKLDFSSCCRQLRPGVLLFRGSFFKPATIGLPTPGASQGQIRERRAVAGTIGSEALLLQVHRLRSNARKSALRL